MPETEIFPSTAAIERKEAEQEELTLGDLLAAVWRHRYWAAVVWIFVTGTVFIALLRQIPMFEARATLFFNRDRQASGGGNQSLRETRCDDLKTPT